MATGDKLDRTKLGAKTFFDDFNGVLNPTWRRSYSWCPPMVYPDGKTKPTAAELIYGHTIKSNGETEVYLDPSWITLPDGAQAVPLKVMNSNAILTAFPLSGTDQKLLPGMKYGSALLTSQGLFSQAYGLFEVRALHSKAWGAWSAFWLLNAEAGEEIDVFEVRPESGDLSIATCHPAGVAAPTDLHAPPKTDITAWHVYSVLWEPGLIVWYIDDVEVFRAPVSFTEPHYILLNIAVDAAEHFSAPQQMFVDFVRVYGLGS